MSQLLSLKTNLKSLRYGQDRPGGGDSGQPYIKTNIPGNTSLIPNIGILGGGTGGEDFLLRGGTLTPSRVLKDVSRLTKMFFDLKSPNGVLFAVKQNVLSRTGTKTQASGILNEGIYTPLSTLAQAAGTPFGIHVNKQGLNPFRDTSPDARAIRSPWGLPVYSQIVKSSEAANENRLVQLQLTKLPIGRGRSFLSSFFSAAAAQIATPRNQISRNNQEILKYGGGPNSILGVGTTTIKRYSFSDEGQTKAEIAQASRKNFYGKTFFTNITPTKTGESIVTIGTPAAGVGSLRTPYLYTNTGDGEFKASIAPQEERSLYGKTFFPNITPTLTLRAGVFAFGNAYRSNLYTNTNDGLNFSIVGNDIFKGKYYVLDSSTIFKKTKADLSSENTNIIDFRTEIPASQIFPGGKKNILSASPDYKTKNIENRINLGDPGKRSKDVSSYVKGTGDKLTRDLINAHPLYKSVKADHYRDRNDLVKFSIGIIDNDNPKDRVYIHFRATLDSMDDQYSAEWNDFRYMGRGEKFYRYNGFTRTVNLGWTVAAQSKEELIPMYQKLNFLASSLAPDYSANGYMRGNLAVLTVGGYIFEQPGIITGINYGFPTESPWEIGINDVKGVGYGSDHTVKELPHIIRVTGFSFIPIHQFVPGLQDNQYRGVYANKNGADLNRVISGFGKERFIALSRDTNPNATTTNYNPTNNYTFGPSGIVASKPSLPNPTPPQIPTPTSLSRRSSASNPIPVPARNPFNVTAPTSNPFVTPSPRNNPAFQPIPIPANNLVLNRNPFPGLFQSP